MEKHKTHHKNMSQQLHQIRSEWIYNCGRQLAQKVFVPCFPASLYEDQGQLDQHKHVEFSNIYRQAKFEPNGCTNVPVLAGVDFYAATKL